MKILISGGGIAGLCSYIALKQDNHEVSLVETRKDFSPNGVGIVLGINVMLMLEKINLANKIREKGQELNSLKVTDNKGKVLSFVSLQGLKEKYQTSSYAIKRQTFHTILESRLESKDITFNKRILQIEDTNLKKLVYFEDGTKEEYDLVIIAEGIHSQSRKDLLGKSSYRYSGYTCWRTLVNFNSGNELIEMWGNQKRMGIVPVNETQSYIFFTKTADASNQYLKEMKISDLKNEFKDFSGLNKELMNSFSDTDTLIHNDLYDYSDILFEKNGILFIGDSSHAMTPNMGQGAAMGIEDAIILAQCIKEDPHNFRQTFSKKRFKRVEKIHKTSWMIGKLVQTKSYFLQILRNKLSQLTSGSMSKQIESGVIKPILQFIK